MSLIDAIRQANQKQTLSVFVPEWNAQIYYTNITCKDLNDLQVRHPNLDLLKGKISLEAMVDLIIRKAMDGQGKSLFTLEHKPELMRSPVNVIAGLAGEILGSAVSSVEDAEKN